MSDFADLERFGREHASCGGITPSAMPKPGGGGYLLTLRCACGAAFDRWVSPDAARRPLPIPSRPTPTASLTSGRVPSASAPVGLVPAGIAPAATAEATPVRTPSGPAAPSSSSGSPGSTPAPAARAWSAGAPSGDTTIRGALPQPMEPTRAARRGSRRGLAWLVLVTVVGLGAAGALYVADQPDGALPLAGTTSPGRRSRDPQRAALQTIARSLRDLHAVATSTTSVSVYATRVTGVKDEAEGYLSTAVPAADRTRVREALDIHLLAVRAWRARSLDQKEAWEAVGLDPSIALCPPLRLVADFANPSENVSRAQARGAAVARALPLLWECANERVAALEQTLAGR